jgi:hypothetical protein
MTTPPVVVVNNYTQGCTQVRREYLVPQGNSNSSGFRFGPFYTQTNGGSESYITSHRVNCEGE